MELIIQMVGCSILTMRTMCQSMDISLKQEALKSYSKKYLQAKMNMALGISVLLLNSQMYSVRLLLMYLINLTRNTYAIRVSLVQVFTEQL